MHTANRDTGIRYALFQGLKTRGVINGSAWTSYAYSWMHQHSAKNDTTTSVSVMHVYRNSSVRTGLTSV
jgi:hypothetical protein